MQTSHAANACAADTAKMPGLKGSPTRDVTRRMTDIPVVQDVVGFVPSVYPMCRNPTDEPTASTAATSNPQVCGRVEALKHEPAPSW